MHQGHTDKPRNSDSIIDNTPSEMPCFRVFRTGSQDCTGWNPLDQRTRTDSRRNNEWSGFSQAMDAPNVDPIQTDTHLGDFPRSGRDRPGQSLHARCYRD